MGAGTTRGTRGATAARTSDGNGIIHHRTTERRSTETKASFKTTEFFAYLAVLAGILVAGLLVDDAGAGGFRCAEGLAVRDDPHRRDMVSRGLAKSGSRDPYTHDHGDH